MNTDADKWLYHLDRILKKPAKNLFSATTDDDIFRGHLSGYSFYFQRETSDRGHSHSSNLTVEGVVNCKEGTVSVSYRQSWNTLTLYLFINLIITAIAIMAEGSPLYIRLLSPFIIYVFQLLRFNYELSISSILIEKLCKIK